MMSSKYTLSGLFGKSQKRCLVAVLLYIFCKGNNDEALSQGAELNIFQNKLKSGQEWK